MKSAQQLKPRAGRMPLKACFGPLFLGPSVYYHAPPFETSTPWRFKMCVPWRFGVAANQILTGDSAMWYYRPIMRLPPRSARRGPRTRYTNGKSV